MDKYKSLSVLIVDDVANMRSFLTSSLRSIEVQNVRDASSAKAGMLMYEEKRPDILFLDLDMPGISGMTALRSLKQKDPSAFVVIVSGESQVDNVKEALKLGAKGFVVKPYSMQKIMAMLDKALDAKQKRMKR
ncbi:response regulator [Planctobacterium marinum]|uniref:Response regulator n=1 Tax=Planctobacterium marinum TaxID=1631968 RepID=A0AA48HWW7_9ALTE|nr:response regulator [Planctobacterium marinum]